MRCHDLRALYAAICAIGYLLAAVGSASAQTTPNYTTNYVWDVNRRLVMKIEPDPGTGVRVATRYVFDLNAELIETDKGTTSQSSGGDFSPLQTNSALYDVAGNLVQESVFNGVNQGTAPPIFSVTQTSYDADNRVLCVAIRQNPTGLGANPPGACTQGPVGNSGQDLITQKLYDAAGEVLKELKGVGSPQAQTSVAYGYTLSCNSAQS